MEWINIISNRDARVSKININNSYVTLEIECWNGELRKINFKKITIEWNSIVNIKYSPAMQWFVIKCSDGTKGYFSVMLKGMKPFAEMILQKVAAAKTDIKTHETLISLKNGTVVGSF